MRKHSLVAVIIIAVAALTVYAGGSGEAPGETVPAPVTTTDTALSEAERGEIQEILTGFGIQTFRGSIQAVDFSLPVLGGGTTSLSDLEGSFVFLNFWATWCPPCREEMPSMEVLHREMTGAPVKMVAVNVREDAATVQGFIDEFGYTYPILLDSDGRLSTNYGVRGIPTTYFIGPDGTVLGMLVGTRYWDEPEVMDGMKRIAEILSDR